MSSPSPGKRRSDTDVLKLIESRHEVTILGGLNEFSVKFRGPTGSFMNKIYHPNIDEGSGTVCLDVINQAWSALFDLINVFESFLPQLLAYPNPTDPLNGDAAALYLHQREEYEKKIREYVEKYATVDALKQLAIGQDSTTDEEDCSSMSDFSDTECQDMEL